MKRKWRFSLRALILLPLVVALGLFIFDRLWVYDSSNKGTELVVISVIDGETGNPIVGAVLESSDTKKEPEPKTTDAKGEAAFAHSTEYQHFESLLRERHNHLSSHEIKVSAIGFDSANIQLESFRLGKEDNYLLPNPIVVKLDRSASNDVAE